MDLHSLQKKYHPGEFIYREGDPGNFVYIVDAGNVEVSVRDDSPQKHKNMLGKGQIFGELALIERRPRTGSARASGSVQVTEIPLDYIDQKISQSDPTIRMFLRFFMARNRDLNARLTQVLDSLALPKNEDKALESASRTLELKSLASHLVDMKGRIDSAISKPEPEHSGPLYSERTMEISKALLTEELLLKNAIAKKEFAVFYQPIIDLSNHRIAGCEALVRWNHPSGELVLPSRFLSQVEKNDLIIELGYWIAEQACHFQSKVSRELDYDLFVSINLSGKQFDDPMLITSLDDIMQRTGANRQLIKFEITESLIIDNPDLAKASLNQLKQTGAKLALDDFGTGYSSFSYLHHFPFDTLKIDRIFVTSMSNNEKSMRIIRAMINLAHDLGMEVIAEGIESTEEVEILSKCQTTFGQGFYYSRAVSETDFAGLLQNQNFLRTQSEG